MVEAGITSVRRRGELTAMPTSPPSGDDHRGALAAGAQARGRARCGHRSARRACCARPGRLRRSSVRLALSPPSARPATRANAATRAGAAAQSVEFAGLALQQRDVGRRIAPGDGDLRGSCRRRPASRPRLRPRSLPARRRSGRCSTQSRCNSRPLLPRTATMRGATVSASSRRRRWTGRRGWSSANSSSVAPCWPREPARGKPPRWAGAPAYSVTAFRQRRAYAAQCAPAAGTGLASRIPATPLVASSAAPMLVPVPAASAIDRRGRSPRAAWRRIRGWPRTALRRSSGRRRRSSSRQVAVISAR